MERSSYGFFVDETGKVSNAQVKDGSGHADLDAAAVRVAEVMVFSPAENNGREVPVWISLPIVFKSR